MQGRGSLAKASIEYVCSPCTSVPCSSNVEELLEPSAIGCPAALVWHAKESHLNPTWMPSDLLNTGSDLVHRLPAASCSYLDVRELLKTVDVCEEPELSPRLRLSPVVAHVQPEVLQHLGRAAAPKAAPLLLLGLAEGSSVPFLRLRLQRLLAGRLLGDNRIAEGVASLEQGGGLSSGKHSH